MINENNLDEKKQSTINSNPNDYNNNNNQDIIIERNLNQNNANDNYTEIQSQLINANNYDIFDKFSSQEIYEILNDLVPSIFYSLIIYYSFKKNRNYCDPNMYLMLKVLICIFFGYICNSLFRSYLLYKNKAERNPFKLTLLFLSTIITTSYLFSTFISYFIYAKSDPKCFVQDNLTTIVFYGSLFVGLIFIFQKVINCSLICVWFVIMINSFFANPSFFYAHYGIDPEIIKNLPTIKADKKHISFCVICIEDIKEGDEIMILKCPSNHFFHGNCIKSWLLVKTICPMCRSENVL